MIRVFYDAGALFIDGRDDPLPAATLVASAAGSVITIQSIHATPGAALVVCDVSLIADGTGAGFASVDAALSYLAGQFAMTRSVDIPTASGVAAADLAAGMPVAISRATGQMLAARADTYALSFVPGIAAADAAAGFIGRATRNALTLPDWTKADGTAALASGQVYFLAPGGGMTTTPPSLPFSACSVRLGTATGPLTFLFQPSDPIRL